MGYGPPTPPGGQPAQYAPLRVTSPDDVAKYEKSDEAKVRVRKALDASFVFDALNEKEKARVVESLKEVKVGSGETVINYVFSNSELERIFF